MLSSKMKLKKNLMVTESVVGLLVQHKSTHCQKSVERKRADGEVI
jgi:hypothetical protein